MKKVFFILSCVLLLSGSLFNTASAKQEAVKYYSGEEIFKGITLGQGPVAELFKERWSSKQLKVNNDKKMVAFANETIKKMKQADRYYFEQLKKAVYSENHLETKKLLKKGSDLFISTASKENKVTKKGEVSPNAGLVLGLYVVAVATTAVAVSHAGAVTFYLWKWGAGPGLDSNSSVLKQEMVIDKLIQSLN